LKSKADYCLDFRGAIAPITLLKTTQVFRQMKENEILEILGRDSGTRTDLFKVLPPFSYELIALEEHKEDLSYRIQLKKKLFK
jgi:TusA-related sulfurtransferase